MTPPNHEIKILTATTSTLKTSTSVTTTGSLSRASARPTSKSRTQTHKTIQPTCIRMTTRTSAWTTQSYWRIRKSPSTRLFSNCSSERTPLTPGTSRPTPSTIITLTVSTSAIFASASSHLKSNSKGIPKYVLFSTLPEIRSTEMKKTT